MPITAADTIAENWPQDEAIIRSIEADFKSDWGDRRQEIVFIGLNINKELVTECLDKCLLNDQEMGVWEKIMNRTALSEEQRAQRLAQKFEGEKLSV
jgi:hypothetical protein